MKLHTPFKSSSYTFDWLGYAVSRVKCEPEKPWDTLVLNCGGLPYKKDGDARRAFYMQELLQYFLGYQAGDFENQQTFNFASKLGVSSVKKVSTTPTQQDLGTS